MAKKRDLTAGATPAVALAKQPGGKSPAKTKPRAAAAVKVGAPGKASAAKPKRAKAAKVASRKPAAVRRWAIAQVLDGLARGVPLAVICRRERMPCDDTIRAWAAADAELARAIARAREAGFDALAWEALEIIDAEPERVVIRLAGDGKDTDKVVERLQIDSGAVAWAKARVETRLKLLSKWDPKRYGEMIKHGNADGSNIDLASMIAARRARVIETRGAE